MKLKVGLVLLVTLCKIQVIAQKVSQQSPNQKIAVALYSEQNTDVSTWYLKVSYNNNGKITEAVPRIDLGLLCGGQEYKELKFLKAGKQLLINEQYTNLHGKRSACSNAGNEIIVSFENAAKSKLNISIRAYNDGIAFRYEFPEKQGAFVVNDELTAYTIPEDATRWLQKWNTPNEYFYSPISGSKAIQQDWCYPALINSADKNCWVLLHEADVNRSYCGSKLSNTADKNKYKITFPDAKDGMGLGDSLPRITLPWRSPWRIIMMGSLADIVGSTLTDDVSAPSVVSNTSWIKPGVASWNYWSNNHGTKDYKIVCEFADLAARMNWPYTLLDWEWDAMSNGGTLEDAAAYIRSKGVKPLIWYNSGGKHTPVGATPRDRLLTHESRMKEFSWLKKMGFAGVKVDFFESEKQDMIAYYLDILNDAAQNEMMIYFHGCLVPRGWARTYPNLMTYEGVRGAEWYNYSPEYSIVAPEHNSILPFTRNVPGSMDYTPVTFTNSQNPHLTSYGHELALSVVFESGFQHMADRPEGYDQLPDAAKTFLKQVPNAWDDTKLVDGYPGKDITLARRKGECWYLGAINGESYEKNKQLKFDFLPAGIKYKLSLIADGKHDKEFETRYTVVDSSGSLDVKMLRRGGFVATLTPLK